MTKFKSGQSGNPAGRPKGAGKIAKLRTLLEPHAGALVKKAVEMAKAGDTTALRICLERLIPALKPTESHVILPGLKGTLTEQGERIIQEMGRGILAPSEASTLLQALSAQARITELDELERRISALEEQ